MRSARPNPFPQLQRLEFESAVRQHNAKRHARGFSSWGQFIAMLFCQLARAGQEAFFRRIEFYDEQHDRVLVFLTNHLELAAATVAAQTIRQPRPCIVDQPPHRLNALLYSCE